MADANARDAKLIQYLNEAYGKEKQLETSLQAHIAMTTRAPYRKRLQQHLKETRAHAKGVERRIKKLGGTAETVSLPGPDAVTGVAQTAQNVANRAAALAQGPIHAARGTGEQEKLLKNAKTQFSDEAEEIATYSAIEALAESVGDKETAKLAGGIRREEERMSKFLEKLIPGLSRAVAKDEIPAPLRKPASSSSKRSTGRRSTARGSTARKSSARGSTARASGGAGSKRSASSSRGSKGRASSSGGSKRSASSSRGSSGSGAGSRGSRARGRGTRSR